MQHKAKRDSILIKIYFTKLNYLIPHPTNYSPNASSRGIFKKHLLLNALISEMKNGK